MGRILISSQILNPMKGLLKVHGRYEEKIVPGFQKFVQFPCTCFEILQYHVNCICECFSVYVFLYVEKP